MLHEIKVRKKREKFSAEKQIIKKKNPKKTTWKFYSKVQRLKLKITTWAIEKEVTEKNPKKIY